MTVHRKRPRDFNQAAKLVIHIATGEIEDRPPTPEEQGKDPAPLRLRRPKNARPEATVDHLTLFGLLAVTAMLIFYALEDYSPWFVLAFACACVLASIYGFLQGAWPFGIIEAIWAAVAVYRWRNRLPYSN